MDVLKNDIKQKYELAQKTFSGKKASGLSAEELDKLRLFSFACELGFDIYLKQLMLENICDRLKDERSQKPGH